MIIFWSIITIVWLLLLVVLLRPLLRRRQAELQRFKLFKSRVAISVLIAVFVVASSGLLYVYWSEGYAVLLAEGDQERDMLELTEQLADRLAESPDNPEGWLLLASSYTALGQYDDAVGAYAQAERYSKLEAWAQIAYAEALLVAEGGLNTKAIALLEEAIARNPDDPQGLFLIGLANLEQENYLQTISYWEHLLTLLEEDGSLANAVKEKLVEVREMAGENQGQPQREPADKQTEELTTDEPNMQDEDCFIRVDVMLATELSSKMLPTDTLFVYAKAAQGPPMPLAIKQFRAAALPLETCLGSEDAMIEGMTINNFDTIRILARISRSGLATPQAGDLQAQSEPLSSEAGNAVSLVIDQILE